jgi:hypothetical protein
MIVVRSMVATTIRDIWIVNIFDLDVHIVIYMPGMIVTIYA